MEHFEDFFEDIFEEFSKFGELEALNVCDNLGARWLHLIMLDLIIIILI